MLHVLSVDGHRLFGQQGPSEGYFVRFNPLRVIGVLMEGILQGIPGTRVGFGIVMISLVIETALEFIPGVIRKSVAVIIMTDEHDAGFGRTVFRTAAHVKGVAENLYVASVKVLYRMVKTKGHITTPSS